MITPTWSHLPPFLKILQKPVIEELKVQQIEALFPQLKLAELPRLLSIRSWDPELWINLHQAHSPLALQDPSSAEGVLSENPPMMPLQNPGWLKADGLLYEKAYAELQELAGQQLLSSTLYKEANHLHHAPPRLVSILPNELIIKEEGARAVTWLKSHGFERQTANPSLWTLHSLNSRKILHAVRLFLEEFPYLETKYLFDHLPPGERASLIKDLELFTVYWDSHRFWMLNKYS
jgi:hypothetical protein